MEIVDVFAIHEADIRWFDHYHEDDNEVFINNYWNGVKYDDTPSWEYLLEGRIILTNDDQV